MAPAARPDPASQLKATPAQGTVTMGEIRASVTLENRDDRGAVRLGLRTEADVRRTTVEGVVDTGAVSLVIPEEIATELGLQDWGTRTVVYADERREERPVTDVTIEIGNLATRTEAIVGATGSEVLIGQLVLEALDLIADRRRRTLVRAPTGRTRRAGRQRALDAEDVQRHPVRWRPCVGGPAERVLASAVLDHDHAETIVSEDTVQPAVGHIKGCEQSGPGHTASGQRLRRARARTMAGRDAAAFIRRRRLIMSLPSPRPGTERTCHPAPRDSRTRTRSTFPTFPASGPRRTAAPPPNHCPRRTHHLSAPWLHARHLAVPAHLPSSAPSSRQPLTFAQTPRTIRSILDFPSSLGRFETVTSFRSVTVARADTAERRRP